LTEIAISISLEDIKVIIEILKFCFIGICTYHLYMKIVNTKENNIYNAAKSYIGIIVGSIFACIIKIYFGIFSYMIFSITLLIIVNYMNTIKNIGSTILITFISLSINYILYMAAVILSFFPIAMLNIENDYISFGIIIIIDIFLLRCILKIKKFKYGISFLKENIKNDYVDLLILNISAIILFSAILIANSEAKFIKELMIALIVFAIIMFVTIQKSLKIYYKQKLLIQDLKETKKELEEKKEEIKELEKENLSISKRSHTLAHRQKSLEYKLNELILKSEIAEENNIKERVERLSKEFNKNMIGTEIIKTGVAEVDDILKYMQSECDKNEIEFSIQIRGNIHKMVNDVINKEDLETLLADNIKNAIIAIKHSDNINKSILTKIGVYNNIYSIFIYDSGIEFEKEILYNLGKKPSTTHKDEGGTGMGFINTFETLRKYKASMEINEKNKTNKEDFTKMIIIKFDKKSEFKIKSYRHEVEKITKL
jgi:signal transduction histidine kinase